MAAKKAAALAAAGAVVALGLRDPFVSHSDNRAADVAAAVRAKIADHAAVVPAREVQRAALMGSSPINPLDVLVVGGGATGCGVALDAATRGLRVGLVEREDFSSGTSSRSTKLIHGGSFPLSRFLDCECYSIKALGALAASFVALFEIV